MSRKLRKRNKFQFICALAGKWNGTNGGGGGYNSKCYSKYISNDEGHDLIQNLDKKKRNDFTELEQKKPASFTLNYHKDEMDSITEPEALKLVAEWKSESTKK